jgi:hypothetical protein
MTFRFLVATAALGAFAYAAAQNKAPAPSSDWQKEFNLSSRTLVTKGRNEYFVLEPGFRLELQGGGEKLHITVLDETKKVDGVETRVVEEREWKNGELYEVSRNYFAIDGETKDVFYFGEEVSFYEKGKVTKHDGSWLAGEKGNKAGLAMPGTPKPKMRYYQEQAPGVAMDRAEIVSLTETCKTPAGTFQRCLKVRETSALNRESEYKYYAPGIGLVRDEDMRLVKYGFISN